MPFQKRSRLFFHFVHFLTCSFPGFPDGWQPTRNQRRRAAGGARVPRLPARAQEPARLPVRAGPRRVRRVPPEVGHVSGLQAAIG